MKTINTSYLKRKWKKFLYSSSNKQYNILKIKSWTNRGKSTRVKARDLMRRFLIKINKYNRLLSITSRYLKNISDSIFFYRLINAFNSLLLSC